MIFITRASTQTQLNKLWVVNVNAILIGGFNYEIHWICQFCLSSCWSVNIFSLNVFMKRLDRMCSLHWFNPIKKYLPTSIFTSICFIMDRNTSSWKFFCLFFVFICSVLFVLFKPALLNSCLGKKLTQVFCWIVVRLSLWNDI